MSWRTTPEQPSKLVLAHHSNRHGIVHDKDVLYEELRPVWTLSKILGLFTLHNPQQQGMVMRKAVSLYTLYSVILHTAMGALMAKVVSVLVSVNMEFAFGQWVNIYTAVTMFMAYYLLVPFHWMERKSLLKYFQKWKNFQTLFASTTGKPLQLNLKRSAWAVFVGVPVICTSTCILSIFLRVGMRFNVRMLPSHVVFSFSYTVFTTCSATWILVCQALGEAATSLRFYFKQDVLQRGERPLVIMEYRKLWLALSAIYRQTGQAVLITFSLNLLVNFVILLFTLYGFILGLINRITGNEISMAIYIVVSILLIYLICDHAHFAMIKMKESFVDEISVSMAMHNIKENQSISKFLQTICTNPPTISLGGFVKINRELFVKLVSTIVTYLVVLLQFGEKDQEKGSDLRVNNST